MAMGRLFSAAFSKVEKKSDFSLADNAFFD
jgi:hypothetical protein